jgi:NMD protein affecting ribosome stability and mRNA decay
VIATSCHHCGHQVKDAMHVMLCDSCLDARLAQLISIPARAAGADGFAAFDRRAPVAA